MSYDPYSRICIPIHYAPVELKIGTQRGATDRALHGTSKEGGSRNDKSKASCPACSSLPSHLLSLFARRMQIALTLMAHDATVQGKKEVSYEELSATFRTFYLYSFECTNPYESLGEGRAHRCTKLRTNKSLWHDRRAQTQLCNASALGNSIYVTVVLLSTYVVLRRGLVEKCLMNNKVLLSPSFFISYFKQVVYIFSG